MTSVWNIDYILTLYGDETFYCGSWLNSGGKVIGYLYNNNGLPIMGRNNVVSEDCRMGNGFDEYLKSTVSVLYFNLSPTNILNNNGCLPNEDYTDNWQYTTTQYEPDLSIKFFNVICNGDTNCYTIIYPSISKSKRSKQLKH
jgi:hypothetical protein